MKNTEAFRSILFPVDFSQASVDTAAHVRGMAQLTGAKVTLLHVIPWLSAWYGESELRPQVSGDTLLQRLEQDSAIALETFREIYFSGIQSSCEIKSGAVAETIIETAVSGGSDLIMMPTRGIGPSRRFLIGSTTAKVLHDASCAVWTSPHLASFNAFAGYKHIVCTLDRDDIPHGYVEEAIRFASSFQSKLTFVTAVPSFVGGCGDEHRVESLPLEFPQIDLLGTNAPADCDVVIETGPVGDVIKKVAETQNADLVLTNRGHIKQPFGRFRTHTYEIVLESPCPVISLCIHSDVPNDSDVELGATKTDLVTA
jgi:nucleotide-binding universal stress UspA family protein